MDYVSYREEPVHRLTVQLDLSTAKVQVNTGEKDKEQLSFSN